MIHTLLACAGWTDYESALKTAQDNQSLPTNTQATATVTLTSSCERYYYPDVDLDGYGDPTAPMNTCNPPADYVDNGEDCFDLDPDIYGGAERICEDGKNNDCTNDYEIPCDLDGELVVAEPWYQGPENGGDGFALATGNFDGIEGIDLAMSAPMRGNISVFDTRARTITSEINLDDVGTNFGTYLKNVGDPLFEGYDQICVGDYVNDTVEHAIACFSGAYFANLSDGLSLPTFVTWDDERGSDYHVAKLDTNQGSGHDHFAFALPASSTVYGFPLGFQSAYTIDDSFEGSRITGQEGSNFGTSIATDNDVTGDGISDVVVGAPTDATGSVWIFDGSEGIDLWNDTSAALAHLTGTQSESKFGNSLATYDDIDADGYADFVIAAPDESLGDVNGAFYVVRGPVETSATQIIDERDGISKITSDSDSRQLGTELIAATDLNHDGRNEVLLTIQNSSSMPANSSVYGWFGLQPDAEYEFSSADFTLSRPDSSGNLFAFATAAGNDFDGDDIDDLVLSDPFMIEDSNTYGALYLLLGQSI